MTTNVSQASSSSASMSYIAETAFGVTPESGVPKYLRFTGEGLNFSHTSTASAEINASRQVTDSIITDAELSGNFDFELSYREYDPFIAALLASSFSTFGTGGVKTITGAVINKTAGTITGAAESFTGLVVGQYFSIGGSILGNNGYYRIGTVTGTVITVDAETPLAADETADLDVSSTRISNGTSGLTTFSMEKVFTDVSQFFMYRGCAVSQMDLNFAVGSILTGSFNMMGAKAARSDTTLMPDTPDASEAYGVSSAVTGVGNILVRNSAGASILGGAYINSASVSINAALRTQKALSHLGAIGIGTGTFEITGNLEVYLKTGSIYDAALADQLVSVVLPSVDVMGYGYALTFANVKLGVPDVNAGSKDQDVLMNVPFTAVAPSATDRMITIDRFGAAAIDS